ncbi:hypothetical protein J6E39_07480 [bacterium]|nr:hypothetical protein [bacterium]
MTTDKTLSNTEIEMIRKFFSEFEDVQFNTKEELYTTVHNIVRNDYHFVYLIFKLLRRTPKIILEQYIKIINSYASKEKYQKEYVDLCKKFETDLLFKRYAEFVSKYIDTNDKQCRLFAKYIIYNFSYNYLNDYILLTPDKYHLNLHLIYKWMIEQKEKINNLKLTDLERTVLKYNVNGYAPKILRKSTKLTKAKLSIVNKSLSKKFKTNDFFILGVLGYIYNPSLYFFSTKSFKYKHTSSEFVLKLIKDVEKEELRNQ